MNNETNNTATSMADKLHEARKLAFNFNSTLGWGCPYEYNDLKYYVVVSGVKMLASENKVKMLIRKGVVKDINTCTSARTEVTFVKVSI